MSEAGGVDGGLTSAIYDAVVDEARWPDVLRQVAVALRADWVVLGRRDARPGQLQIDRSHNLAPETRRRFLDGYAAIDPHFAPDKLIHYQPGAIVLSHEGAHFGAIAIIDVGVDRLTFLSTTRSRSLGPFTPGEVAILRRLLPHLRRAVAISQRLYELRAKADSLAVALDGMAIARNLYRLTPAEARVAELLATGISVGEIAATLDVAVATIRTHLKRTYAKTGTRSQADLVRHVLNMPRLRGASR